jgi:ABC-type phosphate transport system substrate-binding protein
MSASRYTTRRLSTILTAVLALALWLCSTIAQAESIAVIVNTKNPGDQLRAATVAGMYHGETLHWPNGERIKLVNREISAPVRKQFYEQVLNAKSDQVFFRQGTPVPVQSVIERSDEAVINFVATIEGAIGYVSLSRLREIGNDQVKVILIIE